MGSKSVTIAGDYQGDIKSIVVKGRPVMCIDGKLLSTRKKVKKEISKETVESYEVLDESSQTSMASGVARGIIGGALLGGVGAIAGAASAKKKGLHTVSIVFKDGTKSLCQLDDLAYKNLLFHLY